MGRLMERASVLCFRPTDFSPLVVRIFSLNVFSIIGQVIAFGKLTLI
jgi:hypothetical protein